MTAEATPPPGPAPPRGGRRGLPILLAGLGLFAYAMLSPRIPHERHVSYRFPRATAAGALSVRWSEAGASEPVREARFSVGAGQTQSAHDVVLADGDYTLEAELPGAVAVSAVRTVHVDADTFTIVFE